MKILTLEQVLQFHTLALLKDSGADGMRDLGRLHAAIATQKQVVFGEELYKSVFAKAAAIIRGVIADHPFVDGNKRTALLSGLVLLETNGVEVCARAGELEDFAVIVATKRLSVEDIALWLEDHAINKEE